MKRLKVEYSNKNGSATDIDMELDKKIREFFESLGFTQTGQGMDLRTHKRDLGFVEAPADTEPF